VKQTVERTPASFEAQHNLGEFYIQQGKLTAAIPYLERAQRIDPSHYVNSYDLALIYLKTGAVSKARQQISNVLARKPTAELHNLMGDVEAQTGNAVAAADEYQRAAHMEPSEKHLFDWGNHLLSLQAYEPATQVFTHGVQKYPRSTKLLIGVGIAYYSRGQYDEAVKSLCAAADLRPSDPQPYLFLGKMYGISTGMASELAQRLSQFVQLHPKNAWAHFYYAMSQWKGQRGAELQIDLRQIESSLKKAVTLDPTLAEAHFQLGILYSDTRKFPDAIREFRQTIKLHPDLDEAHYRLGQIYQRSGQEALAAQQLETYRRLHQQKMIQKNEKTKFLVGR
jgi:tetratricopeptide (TPR) repeat protein